MHVAVEMATQITLAIVEMQGEDTSSSDRPIEIFHCLLITGFGSQFIAGGKHMTGVETGSGSFRGVDGIDIDMGDTGITSVSMAS